MLFHIKVCVIRHFFIYIYPSDFGVRIFFRHFDRSLHFPSRLVRSICSKKREILSKKFSSGRTIRSSLRGQNLFDLNHIHRMKIVSGIPTLDIALVDKTVGF